MKEKLYIEDGDLIYRAKLPFHRHLQNVFSNQNFKIILKYKMLYSKIRTILHINRQFLFEEKIKTLEIVFTFIVFDQCVFD